jgi:hypothetical protein
MLVHVSTLEKRQNKRQTARPDGRIIGMWEVFEMDVMLQRRTRSCVFVLLVVAMVWSFGGCLREPDVAGLAGKTATITPIDWPGELTRITPRWVKPYRHGRP